MPRPEKRVLRLVVALDEERARVGAIVDTSKAKKPQASAAITEQATERGLQEVEAWVVRQVHLHFADFVESGQEVPPLQ